MKALNSLKYIANASEEIGKYKGLIETSENYTSAKNVAYQAIGFLNSMVVFLNTMICMENNDFTGELDEVIDDWRRDLIQTLINKAEDTHQDYETLFKLYKIRDDG